MSNKNWYVKAIWHKRNGGWDNSDYLIDTTDYHKALKVYSSEIRNNNPFRDVSSNYYDTITIEFGWYIMNEDGELVDNDILYMKEFKR